MKAHKIFLSIVGVIVALFVVLLIVISTINVDNYRSNIVAALTAQTGRNVTLNGPIKLNFSVGGLTVAVNDAGIANPSWASRPTMAGIGQFRLGVAFWPLLSHRLEITEVNIVNADIQLETNANNQSNWEFQPAVPASAKLADTKKSITKQTASSGNVSISLEKVAIKDSQLSLRGADGKMTAVKATDVKFSMGSDGLMLSFKGDYNGTPITLDTKVNTSDITANKDAPFTLALNYAIYTVKANGTANLAAKKASIASYSVTAGGSELHGQMQAAWAAARPRLQGNVTAAKLNLEDFKAPEPSNASAVAAHGNKVVAGKRYVISEEPFDLSGLKLADANLEFSVGELPMGDTSLSQLSGKVVLANGLLEIPFKGKLGASDMSGKLNVNAASPMPQVALSFAAPALDMADLFKLGKMPALLTDNANVQVNLAGAGASPHAVAANASGLITIIGSAGHFSTAALGAVGSGLAELFSGGSSSNVLECSVMRFIVTNGLVKDNGIILDTAPTTVVAKGGFNLQNETIDMTVRARTKMVNVGGILPPVHVGGTFANPGYSADPSAIVQSVVGMLTSGSVTSDIPNVKGPAGQNACLYTAEHPSAVPANSNPILPGAASNAAAQVKDVGNKLIKGLFGN